MLPRTHTQTNKDVLKRSKELIISFVVYSRSAPCQPRLVLLRFNLATNYHVCVCVYTYIFILHWLISCRDIYIIRFLYKSYIYIISYIYHIIYKSYLCVWIHAATTCFIFCEFYFFSCFALNVAVAADSLSPSRSHTQLYSPSCSGRR